MGVATDFRKAVRDLVSSAAQIGYTIDGEREGSSGTDVVAVWATGSSPYEADTQYRLVSVTARVILGRDPEVGPDDDDPLDVMEQIEADVLAAVTPLLGGARVVAVDTAHDPNFASIDFVFVGEIENPAPEV